MLIRLRISLFILYLATKQEAYSVYTAHGIALGRRPGRSPQLPLCAPVVRHRDGNGSPRPDTAASRASLRSATLFAGDSPRP